MQLNRILLPLFAAMLAFRFGVVEEIGTRATSTHCFD